MEFFAKVRERLHEELRADLEVQLGESGDIDTNEEWLMGKSTISDVFRGYYVTQVSPLLDPEANEQRMCTICNTVKEARLEETWQLPVAVPSKAGVLPFTLPELIAHYGGVEKNVNVVCRVCEGNTPHDSRPSYLQTPRVLVIQALRFVTSSHEVPLRRKPTLHKNPVHITFPLSGLDMTMHLRENDSMNEDNAEEVYDLFGVVEHIGKKMDGGHYIAYVRAKNAVGEDCWWKCNDAKCWMVGHELVAAAQGYIWFYERRSQRGTVPAEWGERLHEETEAMRDVSAQGDEVTQDENQHNENDGDEDEDKQEGDMEALPKVNETSNDVDATAFDTRCPTPITEVTDNQRITDNQESPIAKESSITKESPKPFSAE
jgi:Ubiquitin carboxyl-terminal hydrolase